MIEHTQPGLVLDWDSAFWGVTIGRVQGDRLTEAGLADLDTWTRKHSVDCLYFLARSDDPATVELAHEGGFRLVDVRVELTQPSSETEPVPSIRPYRSEDLVYLRTIARTSHEITRFYSDPHFSRDRCSDLYDTWIVRSCEAGWADAVLVAEIESDAAGYVTCHLDQASNQGSIGLIAVSAQAREKGLGRDLALAALGWCNRHGSLEVSVVTQGANVAAQRLFQRCGFRTNSMGLWFHRWSG
jgi:dTDP-4-amino-4,6-dideoxy-D-galactose acyltransferase